MELTATDKKHVRIKIMDLQDKHCKGCEDEGEYCHNGCDVGARLLKLGSLLESKKELKPLPVIEKKEEEINVAKITKEKYLELSSQGKKDKEIMELVGISSPYFYNLKQKWGLVKPYSKQVTVTKKEPKQEESKPQSQTDFTSVINGLKAELDKRDSLIDELKKTIEELRIKLETPVDTVNEELNLLLRKTLKAIL